MAHEFCSMYHGLLPGAGRARTIVDLTSSPEAPSAASPHQHTQCRLPGCTARVFVKPDGSAYEFCSVRHGREFTQTARHAPGDASIAAWGRQPAHIASVAAAAQARPALAPRASCAFPGCDCPCAWTVDNVLTQFCSEAHGVDFHHDLTVSRHQTYLARVAEWESGGLDATRLASRPVQGRLVWPCGLTHVNTLVNKPKKCGGVRMRNFLGGSR